MTETSIAGQVVVITGASSGIGAALARACSQRGAKVALTARSSERLTRVAGDCSGETFAMAGDVTAPHHRRAFADAVVQRWGRIDVLVNNAGVGYYAPFDAIDMSELAALFTLDVFAVVGMTQEALRYMRSAGRGLIVQVASTGGLIAHAACVSAYLAAKHAVVGVSRGLRKDLAGTGIRVQVVCPHLTDTRFFEKGCGADAMKVVADSFRRHMDAAEEVAEGIVRGMDSDAFIVFPTDRSRAAYERFAEAV